MERNSSFIKVSGDLYSNTKTVDFIESIAKESYTVVCVGGGTQINRALQDAGYSLTQHGPLGRELLSTEEREIAKVTLEANKSELETILSSRGIKALVTIPVLNLGEIMCHINGDELVRTVYNGFDKLYILTTSERKSKKSEEFPREKFPKIEIIGI